MKYVGLLRGVNVGGNNIIKMGDLRQAFEKSGFKAVKTYLQSGNILFESEESNINRITEVIREHLFKTFKYDDWVIVKTCEQLQKIASEVPPDWKQDNALRRYIAFIRDPVPVRDVVGVIKPKEGVDFIQVGDGVVYLSTLLSGLTRSGFTKLAGHPVYKDISIRNFTTVQNLARLCIE
jgi:uncharacterized protein (DUF1697 family)